MSGRLRVFTQRCRHAWRRGLPLAGAALLALLPFAPPALAQDNDPAKYPAKTITLIVPFPAGGPTDIFGRIIAEKLHAELGQPVIVDNRVGATGTVGGLAVARAAPDGYTLLFTSNSSHVMAPMLKTPAPYDPLKDYTPVSMMLTYRFALVMSTRIPPKTVPEFIAYAHANPGKLNLGIFGRGSGGHLVSEMFNVQAKVNAVQIPYRGVALLHQALIAREIDYIFDSYGASRPLMDGGHVRILGVTGEGRLSLAPDIPTMKEHGLMKDFDALLWLGLIAPAKMPAPIVAKLQAAVARIVKMPDVQERIKQFAGEAVGSTSEEFIRYIQAEQPAWAKVIRDNDIRSD